MTKRINNPLPYPYSQFFREKPDVKNLNCLEDNSEQTSSNYNSSFIILIVLILLGFNRPIKAASCDESNTEINTASDSNSNIEMSNNNFYE